MPREISCGAVVFIREGKDIFYLLLYRKAHDNYKELWDFPRGLVEKGENEKETIIREIKEETGIEYLKILDGFKDKIKWFYRKEGQLINKEATYYLAETKSNKVQISHEHDDYKWCKYEDALKLITFKNTKDIIKKAKEFLEVA